MVWVRDTGPEAWLAGVVLSKVSQNVVTGVVANPITQHTYEQQHHLVIRFLLVSPTPRLWRLTS